MTQTEDFTQHDANVKLIMEAVAGLWPKFGPKGMPPECIVEGAIRGAGAVLLSLGAKPHDVAGILDDMAAGFRDLDPPKLRLVHSRASQA
ncbi:hypothetical protein [Mesorhizobium sp. M4B.F.Ca.ET.013.02.1.1]|uniref:hypothetical protein n=1 Tax=Mesorhizobium sp. M4B.F.Ca.ET.013.02.1.1 TaxID=2496755 RepID=UPI000FD5DD58|nr:hypothetical protein [Mesorhizobium sp. M4B.F.Ca.ET.013.02.1.1]RUW26940.1 hypothetical protein EOA34_06560 [Mesorhizobium sp. M4B.F.Ca.ET.013.02.1.1]